MAREPEPALEATPHVLLRSISARRDVGRGRLQRARDRRVRRESQRPGANVARSSRSMVRRDEREAHGESMMHSDAFGATSQAEHPSASEVVFSRLLDAPRELVWRMWSELRHIHEWYGPDGFTTTTFEFDFVPGGVWR